MRGVFYTILAVLFCALQTTIFGAVNLFGVRPNLLMALFVCVALLRGCFEGGAVGLLCGLLTDVMGYGTFGVNSLMFLYMGAGLGLLNGKFYRVRGVVAVFSAFAASFTYSFFYYFFAYFVWGNGGMWFALSHKILPESVYTAVAAIPVLFILIVMNKRLREI